MVTSSLNMWTRISWGNRMVRGVGGTLPPLSTSGSWADINDDITVYSSSQLFPPWYDPIIYVQNVHAKKGSFAHLCQNNNEDSRSDLKKKSNADMPGWVRHICSPEGYRTRLHRSIPLFGHRDSQSHRCRSTQGQISSSKDEQIKVKHFVQ
jgi:hypothetical protein